MKELPSETLTSPSQVDPRWELAQRVAGSFHFSKGQKLRAFLLYVCENAILQRDENIREQLIGERVFGRAADYSIYEDNIVRVEARELRKRLAAYFGAEGLHEPWVIEVPKGTYVPVFRLRDVAPPETASVAKADQGANPSQLAVTPAPETLSPGAEQAVAAAAPGANSRRAAWLGIALLISVGVIAGLLVENWRLRQVPDVAGGSVLISHADYSMYSDLMGSLGAAVNREPQLVLSNPQAITFFGFDTQAPIAAGRTILAPQELTSSFGFALRNRDKNLPFHFLSVNREGYTGIGEATAAYRLGLLMQSLRRPVRLTQSRFLNWDQIHKEDLILLGGPSSNDWTYQNDSRSNFLFTTDGGIQNVKPLPGEQKVYRSEPASPGNAVTSYGVIKMLSSPYGYRSLILAGCDSTGTAGVAEFFSIPARMREVYGRIRAASPGQVFPSDWEVVIRIAEHDGVPVGTWIAALRPSAATQ
jgi:hypothetical protein